MRFWFLLHIYTQKSTLTYPPAGGHLSLYVISIPKLHELTQHVCYYHVYLYVLINGILKDIPQPWQSKYVFSSIHVFKSSLLKMLLIDV